MLSATFLNPTTWLEVQGETWEQLLSLACETGRPVNGKFEFDLLWQSLSATPPAGLLEEAMLCLLARQRPSTDPFGGSSKILSALHRGF